jgi:tetratricopeptide (TPR) repeat protein
VKTLSSSLRLLIVSMSLLCAVTGSAAYAQPRPGSAPAAAPARPNPPAPKDPKGAPKDPRDAPKDSKDAAAADQQARAHFQRGQELANQGKYPQAYLEFEAGYRQSHRPLFLFNLGEAARAFGDAGRARGAYQRYLEEDPGGPMVSSAQSRLTDLGPGPATDLGLSRKNEGNDKPPPQTSPLLLPPERFTTVEPREAPSRPMWKKWPFWAAVGGVVAGGVAVYAFTRDTSACGDGCTLVDLR